MSSQTFIIFFFLIFLFVFTPFATSNTLRNSIPRGSSFSVKDASPLLISPDNTFACGFYSISSYANAYWFAIWYANIKDKTVIWMANRDKPVNGQGSRLHLVKDGTFVLINLDGSIVWQTNTSSTNVKNAELLNSGNLVLKDPSGEVLWQSFDYPTDTLLPGQPFTKSKKLVSRVSQYMFGSGYFSFFFDSDNVLRMIYDGPQISSIYWPNVNLNPYQNGRTNYNSSRIGMLDEKGTFVSSDKLQFSASDVGVGIKRRLTIDYDGNFRLYSLNESSGLWSIVWQAVNNQCDVHGLCGQNGICVYSPDPKCSCPPNYEPTDSTDWSKGCKPKFTRNCNDSEFIEIPFSDYYGFDLNYSHPVTFEDCKNLCLGDCRCQAFSYRISGQGMCFTKSALFNGYRSVDFQGRIYMRVPATFRTSTPTKLEVSNLDCGNGTVKTLTLPATYSMTNQRSKWVYLFSFSSAIGVIEIIIFVVGWLFLLRENDVSSSVEDGYLAISNQFKSFTYNELKTATKKFKEVVGTGGFGAVYKGVLTDERIVAVKKLENVLQGEEEFWAEVSTIGRINHMNLARMWGFCSENKHRLLVYEYIDNKSLDKHLFSSTTVLEWKERFKIALGTAKGLAYLHHECLEWVIHCDVKPENILLDVDFEPKISDFGLSKLCQRGGHGSSELTKIRGTKGYMAPEWAMNLPITAKVDVYSYGVVILELVKGIRLSNWVVSDCYGEEEISELVMFVRSAKANIENGDELEVEKLVDAKLKGRFSRTQAAKMIEIGLSCVEEDRNKRPSMEMVAHFLAECEDVTVH